jgi:hypothetical protein
MPQACFNYASIMLPVRFKYSSSMPQSPGEGLVKNAISIYLLIVWLYESIHADNLYIIILLKIQKMK